MRDVAHKRQDHRGEDQSQSDLLRGYGNLQFDEDYLLFLERVGALRLRISARGPREGVSLTVHPIIMKYWSLAFPLIGPSVATTLK